MKPFTVTAMNKKLSNVAKGLNYTNIKNTTERSIRLPRWCFTIPYMIMLKL